MLRPDRLPASRRNGRERLAALLIAQIIRAIASRSRRHRSRLPARPNRTRRRRDCSRARGATCFVFRTGRIGKLGQAPSSSPLTMTTRFQRHSRVPRSTASSAASAGFLSTARMEWCLKSLMLHGAPTAPTSRARLRRPDMPGESCGRIAKAWESANTVA